MGLVPFASLHNLSCSSERNNTSVKSAPSIIAPSNLALDAKAPSKTAFVKSALTKRAESNVAYLRLAFLKFADSKLVAKNLGQGGEKPR